MHGGEYNESVKDGEVKEHESAYKGDGSHEHENSGGQKTPDYHLSPSLSIGHSTYTFEDSSCSCYVIGVGNTLKPGGSITLSDGIKVALATDGAHAVVGTRTQHLHPTILTASDSLNSILTQESVRRTDSKMPVFTGTASPLIVGEKVATFAVGEGYLTAVKQSKQAKQASGYVLSKDG